MYEQKREHADLTPVLRSHPSSVLLMKLGAPLLIIIGTVGVFGDRPFGPSMVISAPLLALAAFQLSLAQLEVRNNIIRYRWIVQWQTIQHEQVLGCGVLWPGLIGYARLRSYVPPFGVLFFVLDTSSGGTDLFRPDIPPLVRYLRGQTSGPDSGTEDPYRNREARNRAFKLFGVALVGAAVTLMRIYLCGPLSQVDSNQPRLVEMVSRFFHVFDRGGVAFIIALVFGGLAIRAHDNRRASLFAFLCGLFVPLIVHLGAR